MINYKILLIDDDMSLRVTIAELLLHNNYTVKTAFNGQNALDILEYWIPDIIISDIMMPIMDGNELYQTIKKSELLNQIPFIFLTAKNDSIEIENSSYKGVDHFITKPFKSENLIQIIKAKIERFEKIKSTHNTIYKNYFNKEIYTPLCGILGSIDYLINSTEENKINLHHNSIKTYGEQLNKTIKNSILYQNFINNKLEFEYNSFTEISNCFNKTKNEITNNIDIYQTKRIKYDIDESNIKINPEYLHFILFELIRNALMFSRKKFKIVVTGKIYDDDLYELTIQDFGSGFTPEEIKKINAFQKFDRKKFKKQGLGLGLYMSMALTKKTGGIFSIISEKKLGTTLKLLFPLHKKTQ